MFTHLHNHTEYSMLDGLSRLEPLVARTRELGMESLAITDHGGLYGAIDFYKTAKSQGVRPIIGCEMYVAPVSRHDRNPNNRTPHHMTVLARDFVGYQNLVRLVSASHLEGFYYKPRVDREVLEQYHQGLIVLSGCPSGEVPSLITQGRTDEARQTAAWYREVFGNYYLEFMRHGDVPELDSINRGLWDIHRETGIPIVATNDSHYILREHARLQDILICIHTNTNVTDDKRLRMEEDSYYLKDPDEMTELFRDLPDAIANTQAIAEMCDLHLDFNQLRMPRYETPDGLTATDFLKKLCWDGLNERIPDAGDAARERLSYELEVIRQTSFDNYFLVVWDIARFVRERDIFFAVRGSAAASLVLFCLGVTNINPLPYGLVFERFLNLERKEMPDIDMDFQDDRRGEVINYVIDRYGRDHVAHIITFGTLGARAAIRDTGRALAMSYSDVDLVARMIPEGSGYTLSEARADPMLGLNAAASTDETVRDLLDTAQGLEGVTRHVSTHAAGVVISQDPLTEVVPLQRSHKAEDGDSVAAVTQYAMDPVADLGLLKMDFLGLANLTVLARARDLIARHRGESIDLQQIPLDDALTFQKLSAGDTTGVFQLEGAGMTRAIRELMPASVEEVAAMIALYRPGPMEHISTFVDAKHGRAPVRYLHPDLEEVLEETYGVIVYQDQVLHIARKFAGYTLGEADTVRKAMGKKVPAIMAAERDKFLAGAAAQGFTPELAEQVFALIEPFAGYAFNKAHAVSYGLISYWTAYLKANYAPEYMVALLNSYVGNAGRTKSAIAECHRLQIRVLPPSITRGHTDFTLEFTPDGVPAVRFGMGAVKNVGPAAVAQVVTARDELNGFVSLEQMCRESDLHAVNRRSLESLIKVGALDEFGDRAALIEAVDRIVVLAQAEAQYRDSSQSSMFDLFSTPDSAPLAKISLPAVTASQSQVDDWERELLGMSLSGIKQFATLLSSAAPGYVTMLSDMETLAHDQPVTLVGQVGSFTEHFTRQNKPFGITEVALLDGQVKVFIWEEQLQTTRALWQQGQLLQIQGVVRKRDEQTSISVSSATAYSPDASSETPPAAAPQAPAPLEDPFGSGRSSLASDEVLLPDGPAHQPSGENVTGVVSGTDMTSGPPWETSPGPVAALSRQPVPPQEPSVQQAPASETARRSSLTLRIVESDNPLGDQMLLDDIKRLLLDHSGEDRVMLEIATELASCTDSSGLLSASGRVRN